MMHRTKLGKLLSDDMNNELRIERKQMEILCETTQKLIQICNKKELKVSDLKWQPHYSTVFKQIKNQLESILTTDSTKNLDNLNKIPYFLQLKNNMFNLFNSFAKFVQDNSSLIGTKDNHARKSFFMKVVHFQFLYFEIQAYFPNGVYTPTNVKISKLPARMWWERKFGDSIFVNIDIFVDKFKDDFPFINQAEVFSFRNSINFTSTTFSTTFEYDLFTRLYSPWEKLTEVWRIIYSHPAYLHFSTYGDTKDTLSKYVNEPGTYVFRISCKDLGFWTIGYVKSSKEMGQVKVDKSNLLEALVEGNKKNMYLYPNGETTNPDLTNLNDYRKEVIVKNDDLALYECFEDFKECKICRELEKDLQLESCGHQICQTCYKLLRKYDKKLCPFCNQKILSTTKIINIKDPSIYVEATVRTNSSVVRSAEVTPNINRSNDVDMRSRADSRPNNDSVYSNMSDDSNVEVPPSVPPRVINEGVFNSKIEIKKTVINYPAIQSNNSFSSSKPYVYQEKKENKRSEVCISSIYSEMSLKSNSIDDTYCDVNEPEIISNTLPNIKRNSPFNAKGYNQNGVSPSVSNKSIDSNSFTNSDIYCSPSGNVVNSRDDVYCSPNENANAINDDLYCSPNDHVNSSNNDLYCSPIDNNESSNNDIYCSPIDQVVLRNVDVYSHPNEHEAPTNDDVYCNPSDHSKLTNDDLYCCPNESNDLSELSSNIPNDVYLIPINGINYDPVANVDEMYSSPTDDFDEDSTNEFHELFLLWNKRDVERAIRVARNDETLAKEILMEFVGKR